MKKIEKSVSINAPKEKVWDVLLQDEYNRQWFGIFSQGTHAETDWKVGSKVTFVDKDRSGIIGKIVTNDAFKELVIEYTGFIMKDIEDYDSDELKEFVGSHETYKLNESNGTVTLDITSDMSDEYFDTMAAQWDEALLKIKELAEN
jgi:hypothetical protein